MKGQVRTTCLWSKNELHFRLVEKNVYSKKGVVWWFRTKVLGAYLGPTCRPPWFISSTLDNFMICLVCTAALNSLQDLCFTPFRLPRSTLSRTLRNGVERKRRFCALYSDSNARTRLRVPDIPVGSACLNEMFGPQIWRKIGEKDGCANIPDKLTYLPTRSGTIDE